MEMMMKLLLLFLTFALQICCLKAELVPIHIDNRKDYEILDQFFRMGFSEEEYGYVLEGAKPISVRDFYPLDLFPVAKDLKYAEKEFTNALLAREAISVWAKLGLSQENFALKAVSLHASESVAPGWEVQFINIFKLRDVIDKNINLFRYILGPATETEQLVKKIAYSEEKLENILKNDRVLEGLVLGFGTHNSLVGGRIETLQALSISKDCAPFSSKSLLMQSHKEHPLLDLSPERYGGYYLEFAGGDDSLFRNGYSPLQSSAGFSNVEEELLALESLHEPLPSSLRNNPGFVFGAFKGGPRNQPFFEQLQAVQKQVQDLLKKTDLLENILEKIAGKKPLITCDKSSFSGTSFSLLRGTKNAQEWASILRGAANRFEDKERQSAFMEAFYHPTASSRSAPMIVGVSKAMLEGLRKALCNLAVANTHFEILSKDSSLQVIAPKQLYSKTTLLGSGKELKGADRVRMGYVVEDLEGNVLFANCDSWLSLSETIPGFAHGVQGMRMGEKRTLFIHPALAFGALTTLPPCAALNIKVHLLDIDESSSGVLSSLTPLDLDWIQNPSFLRHIEESIQQQPRFIGSFYRDMLDKMEELDKTALIVELKKTDG
jgi:peptidylprolyl isomerase